MSCSFIEMPAEKVAQLSKRCLGRIRKERSDQWSAYAERTLERYQRSWWHRLFKTELPTAEGVIAAAKQDEIWAMIIDKYAWKSEEVAQRLLQLAANAEIVHVSAEDLDYIGG